ncbi:LysR family transcriptional regulator [Endozoicomonas sp. SM1973]|uniref:LysR family transcriptional regulator n=1 Tax=Spartinivicinus marinus TaxID=2994442 RepID=A0A853IAH3_9GAMM|nr:LysR family transcriptional regulator [Spartinivicinus marinus]MCX4027048.1 LysR family transcriptional regulator [Spartinivicinus marinus]NYZ67044.1 LysR family transcriptional regulator [Spartinivicinus marinus]
MVKHVEPDKILLKMPSLRAVKSFVAAAKYQNFTRAAEALCVTQAAISRQIRELEAALGVDLFKRAGRAVELTEAGTIFYDAAYLSFVNIAQAADRIKSAHSSKKVLTICCSPAFSALWLSRRLPDFFAANPEIDINVVTTENFLKMEPGVYPDVFINKVTDPREGYRSIPLFHDIIYPVCTPQFLAENPDINTLTGLRDTVLLNLSPYGRAQIAEHVDWSVWFAFHDVQLNKRPRSGKHLFNANDYNMLIQMVLSHQGVSLGWHHLVGPLVDQGLLVRPIEQEVIFKEKLHYLTYTEDKEDNDEFSQFRDWLLSSLS